MNRDLSILELTVLGVVWKKGPCTAYAVMREFVGSQTNAYRSGAGSIYPLIKRLDAANYLSKERAKLAVTDLGRDVLTSWVQMESSNQEVSSNLDPLRSRVYFLDLLPLEGQLLFIAKALKELKALKEDAAGQVLLYQKAGQQMSALAMKGAVLETEARVKFFKCLRRELLRLQDQRSTLQN